jgi:integrase
MTHMTKVLLKYVEEFIDRHGKPHRYFRRGGKRVRLPGLPGSAEFMAAYQAALDGVLKIETAAPPTAPGTVRWLVSAYLSSATFNALAPETRRTRANILENFRKVDGDKRIFVTVNGEAKMVLTRQLLQSIVNKKSITPYAQRNLLNTLRAMFRWAVSEGKLPDDPSVGVTRRRIKNTTKGYRTWTDAEIDQFVARHPIGTKAYLAFVLLLDFGVRRGDAVRLGRQHIRHDLLPKAPHGWLSIVQHKTGKPLDVPLTDRLQAAINAMPNNHLTFLTTGQSRPFTDGGFTNWFRDRCNEAGLPNGLSAHGLRKARARRTAEKGVSAHAVAAITGHTTLSEVQRYTAGYDQRKLALDAMRGEISDASTGEIKKTTA